MNIQLAAKCFAPGNWMEEQIKILDYKNISRVKLKWIRKCRSDACMRQHANPEINGEWWMKDRMRIDICINRYKQ